MMTTCVGSRMRRGMSTAEMAATEMASAKAATVSTAAVLCVDGNGNTQKESDDCDQARSTQLEGDSVSHSLPLEGTCL